MTDADVTTMSDAFPNLRPAMDGRGADAAEQVGIAVERLGGAAKDGVDAAQAAASGYGGLVMDTYVRVVQVSMSSGVEFVDHVLALLRVRTAAEAFALNAAFMQKQMSSVQGRLFAMAGVKGSVVDPGRPPARRA